jgi:hypothetical protein
MKVRVKRAERTESDVDTRIVIHHRIQGALNYCGDLIAESHGVDWKAPAFEGASPVALTLWHVPRTLDWLVNTSIRGVAEVADRPRYGELPSPDVYGFGTGLTPEQVASATDLIKQDDLLRYVSEVGESVQEWLAGLDPVLLDDPVADFDERQHSRPSYARPEALTEVDTLGVLPLGVLLVRPGVSHLFMHLGEANALLQLARSLD